MFLTYGGAIAALWDEGEDIPRYTPNYFPVFFINDLLKGLMDMMELYIEKNNKLDQIKNKITNFIFLDELLLKKNKSTYDIAVQGKEGAE